MVPDHERVERLGLGNRPGQFHSLQRELSIWIKNIVDQSPISVNLSLACLLTNVVVEIARIYQRGRHRVAGVDVLSRIATFRMIRSMRDYAIRARTTDPRLKGCYHGC